MNSGALRRAWCRILSLVRRDALDHDLEDELASHLALAADEHERAGMAPEVARRKAMRQLGNRDAAMELHRDARGFPSLDSFNRDVRQALRGFRREPGFTLVALLILALGIGANTAVFSVVNPLLLRPLPFADPDGLVWVAGDEGTASMSSRTFQVGVFEEFQRRSRSFSDWTAYFAFFNYFSYTLTGRGDPERLVAVNVGPRFFELLGIRPAIGRTFTSAELRRNGPKVAILGHALWQRRFAADPGIVGQTIMINREPVTVVGVQPASFDFTSVFTPGVRVDLFVPAILDDMREWGNTLAIVARLQPGVSIEEARAELRTLVPQIEADRKEFGPVRATLTDLKEHVSGGMRRPLLVLWAAVGLVLLIVCANLANLLLARATARSREFALRVALGASRTRLVRQLLTEGVLLAVAGAALGVPVAYALSTWLASGDLQSIPLLHHVQVDGAALAVTAAVGIVTGLLFATAPALRASGLAPHQALKEHTRGSSDSARHAWVRKSLVITEIGMAAVLLVGAGLLGRSFIHLLQVELGFQPIRAVTTRLDATWEMTPQQRTTLYAEAARRASALPGVEAVGLTDALPLDRNRTWGVLVPGRKYDNTPPPLAFAYVVSPGYLRAMGVSLRRGRDLSDSDVSSSARVAMVSETLARTLYPDVDPLGRTILVFRNEVTIVGVVADVRQTSLDEAPVSQLYVPLNQNGSGSIDLIARTALPPSALTPALRTALAEVDSRLATTEVRPIEDLVDRALSPRRFLVSLLAGFSALALILATLGIYGVVSYGVSRRVSEFGVRMALGATGGDVCRHVLADTVRLVLAGLALGAVASLALTRLISSLLFGTSPTDPVTFTLVALLLAGVALLAGYLPALRASRIEPMRALRAE
jgi:predicted permease